MLLRPLFQHKKVHDGTSHLVRCCSGFAPVCDAHHPGSGTVPGATPRERIRQLASKLGKPALSPAGIGVPHQWSPDRATAVQRERPLSEMVFFDIAHRQVWTGWGVYNWLKRA